MAKGYPKGRPRPPGAGRKAGTPNKPHPITMDVIKTLQELGHDPAAVHVALYNEAMKNYRKKLKNKNEWGASGLLHAAIQANGDLMKYVYPTRKAVDHNVKGSIALGTYTEIAKALLGNKEEIERDVTGSEGEEDGEESNS